MGQYSVRERQGYDEYSDGYVCYDVVDGAGVTQYEAETRDEAERVCNEWNSNEIEI